MNSHTINLKKSAGKNNIPAALHFKTTRQLLVLTFINVIYAFTVGSPDR
jgi:hypothetical protein